MPSFAVRSALLCAAIELVALVPASVAQDAGKDTPDEQTVRSFALPDTRAARAREASAEGHIAARRWSEALNDLQSMLDDQRGDVMPGTREPAGGSLRSQQPVHAGAAARARQRLFELPREAQDLYREHHENEARIALESARARGDRRALVEVARRWPLTRSAERAWWSLGDLELEVADTPEALYAWRRALASSQGASDLPLHDVEHWRAARERIAKSDSASSSGMLQRIDFAIQFLDQSGARRAPASADGVRNDARRGPRVASAMPPGRDADSWPEAYHLPLHPFTQNVDSLFAARAGDALLVSTSLRLIALNAYTGTVMWDSDEPPGWSAVSDSKRGGFFSGIDRNGAMIAPAAGAHVAVAALQLPISFIENEDFQQTIPITRKMPERRLFAFDLATGRKLWDHTPPPLWDGESGGFTDRMTVAGPPVVVGTRLIAPFCRMQGRIDYHVGCIDLDTGNLLWSTSLVSGQRELNMFGRQLSEFCAPPVCVVDDRVIALTQLGAVACLDLFTGEIRWETTYSQIPLRANREFQISPRRSYWKNAPPSVAGDVAVCTPYDSADLFGLDVQSGSMLWSLSHDSINGFAKGDVDLLIGATEDAVYLGSSKIVALESRNGLRNQAPIVPHWPVPFEDEDMRGSRPGRPVLFGDHVLVATPRKRIDIDASLGRVTTSLPWAERRDQNEGHGGNLLAGAGELFSISGGWVDGYFEWDVLVQRARRAFEQRPNDPRTALELGQLLSNRGEGEWQKGQTESARVHLSDAEAALQRGLSNATGESARVLKTELHLVLRRSARVHADLADGAGALQALHTAEDLAPSRESLRDTLLEEIALLRDHETPERRASWLHALESLERSCADLAVSCELSNGEENGTGGGFSGGLSARYVPLVGSAAKSDAVPFEMPLGLWVMIERSRGLVAAGDVPGAFAELHRIIEVYGDVELPSGRAADLAGESIAALLASGKRDGYETFEARAQQMFDEALKKNDKDALTRIARLYPHSRAARSASDALLTLAVDAGDAALVVRIVQSELPQRFRIAEAKPREVELLARMASVLKRTGNLELANELLRTLAERRPDATSSANPSSTSNASPSPGSSPNSTSTAPPGLPPAIAEALQSARGIGRWTPPEPAPPTGRFAAVTKVAQRYKGEQEFVGYSAYGGSIGSGGSGAAAPSDAATLVVCASAIPDTRSAVISAFAESDAQSQLWQSDLGAGSLPVRVSSNYWTRRVAFAAGRILVATSESIVALDSADGSHAWEWRPAGTAPDSMSLACASGVLVAVVHTSDERYFVEALDAHSGTELWREGMQDPLLQPLPLLSSNQAVFLPVSGRKSFLVRDLFTGRRALQLESEAPVSYTVDQDAWIEGDRLVLPWFNESRSSAANQLVAFDLASGRVLWRLGFGEDPDRRMLKNVVQHGSKTYLVVAPWPDAQRPNPPRSMLELSTAIGAASPLSNIRFGAEDRILGLAPETRVRLSTPTIYVFSAARAGARETRVRAVDLESGELWVQTIPGALREIQMRPTPQPAISDSAVAIVYSMVPVAGQTATRLSFFERASGILRDNLELSPLDMGLCENVQLIPLGKMLFVKGLRRMEIRQ